MQYEYKDIFVKWEQEKLLLGNSCIQREIDWTLGMPSTVSLKFGGKNLVSNKDNSIDFELAGFTSRHTQVVPCDYKAKEPKVEPLSPEDGDGIKVTVTTIESIRHLEIEYSYILYPELPVIAVEFQMQSAVLPLFCWTRRSGEEFSRRIDYVPQHNVVERLCWPEFKVTKSIEFQMRTDLNDQPVLEHPYGGEEGLLGNVLLAQDQSGQSLFYLQEAPPSQERRSWEKYDFSVSDACIASIDCGINPEDIIPHRRLASQRLVLGFAKDGDVSCLIRRYLWTRRPVSRKIAGAITVNPWGCGKFTKLVSEEFLHNEVRAASQLCADFYQIDDGYEQGGLLVMMIYNRPLDRHFWEIKKERFPEGFAPLVKTANDAGTELALWFAPSSNQAYFDWRESAEIMLDFHRKYGICCFKLDAVNLQSYAAEENFLKLLRFVHQESGGRIVVNLDVTNGTRGGLYRFAEFGTIFLENRYVCHKWPRHLYHPGHTLSNLWHLAHWCNVQFLQIEIASPDDCVPDNYRERGLDLPTDYPVEYWIMVAAMASPLLWFAPSSLTPDTARRMQNVMRQICKYREQWREEDIVPIGNAPDGRQICGFAAGNKFLLVFRELAAPESARLPLPQNSKPKLLYCTAQEAALDEDGTATLPVPASAALFQL